MTPTPVITAPPEALPALRMARTNAIEARRQLTAALQSGAGWHEANIRETARLLQAASTIIEGTTALIVCTMEAQP